MQVDFTHNPPASPPPLPAINEDMETGDDDVFPTNVSDQLEQLGMDPLDLNDNHMGSDPNRGLETPTGNKADKV